MSLLSEPGPVLRQHSQEQPFPTTPSWFQPWYEVHRTLSPSQKVPELAGRDLGRTRAVPAIETATSFPKQAAQAKNNFRQIPSSSSSFILPQQGNLDQAFCSGEQREAGRELQLEAKLG